jgi:alkyl hydroperoxide reductase subunit F
MLDSSLKQQLRDIFQKLTGGVDLRVMRSDHSKQQELIDLLQEVASTSAKIKVTLIEELSETPRFELFVDGKFSGIRFKGIPSGHEFSSLVLSILNSDGQGKMPDEIILKRMNNIKGPIRIRTYISLDCENCPEVVQALNLIATLHPDFEHEMVDGALAQEEVAALGIQGVPSVVNGETLIMSGKKDFISIVEELEKAFGKVENSQLIKSTKHYDVAIAGGGPAGVSAAIYLARKGLNVSIIAGKIGGQVMDTKGIENLISTPYTEGPALGAGLRSHLEHYQIDILDNRKIIGFANDTKKTLTLDSGEMIEASSMIIATGAQWRKLGVPGESEYIGRGVAFCPHCDGPYYKNKDVIVVGGGNSGVEAAIDLAGIVKSVTVFEFAPTLKADQVLINKLNSLPNTKVIANARTHQIIGDGKKVNSVQYENRETKEMITLPIDGVFVQIGLIPNSEVFKNFVSTNRAGEIVVDEKGRTNVPGIYAAGDVTTTPYKQIVIAMGEGAKTALACFEELYSK